MIAHLGILKGNIIHHNYIGVNIECLQTLYTLQKTTRFMTKAFMYGYYREHFIIHFSHLM